MVHIVLFYAFVHICPDMSVPLRKRAKHMISKKWGGVDIVFFLCELKGVWAGPVKKILCTRIVKGHSWLFDQLSAC